MKAELPHPLFLLFYFDFCALALSFYFNFPLGEVAFLATLLIIGMYVWMKGKDLS